MVEKFSVQRTGGLGSYRPDFVVFVNVIPLAIIEGKRPVSTTRDKAVVEEGISLHLRNRQGDGIQDLYCQF